MSENKSQNKIKWDTNLTLRGKGFVTHAAIIPSVSLRSCFKTGKTPTRLRIAVNIAYCAYLSDVSRFDKMTGLDTLKMRTGWDILSVITFCQWIAPQTKRFLLMKWTIDLFTTYVSP